MMVEVQAITAAMVMAMATAMTRTMMKTMRAMEASSFRQDFHTNRAQYGVLLVMAPSDFVNEVSFSDRDYPSSIQQGSIAHFLRFNWQADFRCTVP